MIWIFLLLGLPLPVYFWWTAGTPEASLAAIGFTLMLGIPLYIGFVWLWDWGKDLLSRKK